MWNLYKRRITLTLFILLFYLFILPVLLLPLLILYISAIFVYRQGNQIAAKIWRPDLMEIVPLETHFLFKDLVQESSPHDFNILLTSIVNGKLDPCSISEIFERQILCSEITLKEYKNLQRFVSNFGGYFYWKQDSNFKVKNHIRYYYEEEEEAGGYALVNRGSTLTVSKRDLQEILAGLITRPWREGQSMWELLIVTNYRVSGSDSKDKTALILRMHHGMADGYSCVNFMNKFSQGNSSLCVSPYYDTRWKNKILEGLLFPCSFFCYQKNLARKFRLEKDLSTHQGYHVTWGDAIPLPVITSVCKKFGVSFQGVLYALFGGATFKLMKELGIKLPRMIPVTNPWFLPGHPGGLTNYFMGAEVNLVVGEEDPIRSLLANSLQILENVTTLNPKTLFTFNKLVTSLPTSLLTATAPKSPTPLGLTIISCPGPAGPLFLHGCDVLSSIGTVGQFSVSGDATIVAASGHGNLVVSIAMKKRLCPTLKILEKFNDFVKQELKVLLDARPLKAIVRLRPDSYIHHY